MVLHATWNLSSVAGLNGFLAVYAFLQIPVFLGFVGVAVWARRREGRLIGEHLRPYAAAGWLSYPEVDMLARMPAPPPRASMGPADRRTARARGDGGVPGRGERAGAAAAADAAR